MAKRKNIELDRLKKREVWLTRTQQVTGLDASVVETLLSIPRTQSFRLNPLVNTALHVETELLYIVKSLGIEVQEVAWSGGVVVGYSCSPEDMSVVRDSDYVTTGRVYIQNAASWLPVIALDPKPDDVILDVCAAPGGKSSHIQACTNNQSKLTCNDNSKPRLLKLQRNMERLGAEATYALCDATRLSRMFQPETFDRILLDAPCSGEGLMTLDDLKLFDSWSVAHIRRLSELQKKILHESWQTLKPGGTLVYSTCTMAPEENEAVIDYFLRKNPDAKLETLTFPLENRIPALSAWNDKPFANSLSNCLRLTPGSLTEAFFVAKLTKTC